MKIELDFAILEETGMSADDFVYLYIIYRKGFNYLQTLNLRPNLNRMQQSGYIELGETEINHTITDKFKHLFVGNFDQMFSELLIKDLTYQMLIQVLYVD